MNYKNNINLNKYPYKMPEFKNYHKYVYPLNQILYQKLREYNKPCLSLSKNCNDIFFKCLLDRNNVINLMIQNSRGLNKSKFARNLALHIKKYSPENVEFDINSFVFGNEELYNKIIDYLNNYTSIPNQIKIFIVDEDDMTYGEGSLTAIKKTQQILDKIRIMKIIIIKIKPTENIFFFSDIEYAFNLKPIAYNGKIFFCLLKEFNELEYSRNIIVNDYDKFNSKLYLDYFKLKEQNFRKTQQGLKDTFNYLPHLFLIEKEFNIISNQKYKIIKYNIIRDFITINEFKNYCKLCNINAIDSTIISLYETYKLSLTNKKYLNRFKKYCTSFNYNLKIIDNKENKKLELEKRIDREREGKK